jgi:hypothetical protein
MAEIFIGPGDSISRLLQVVAKESGVQGMRWTGKGREDMKAAMLELYHARLMKDALWVGLQELCNMPELKELPESVQAQIAAIVLTARAKFELGIKT